MICGFCKMRVSRSEKRLKFKVCKLHFRVQASPFRVCSLRFDGLDQDLEV